MNVQFIHEGLAVFFDELVTATGSLDRIARLAARLASLHPVEGETIVKLLTGDLRIGLKEGLVDVKVCAVDEVWSGLKFVRRVGNRGKAEGQGSRV